MNKFLKISSLLHDIREGVRNYKDFIFGFLHIKIYLSILLAVNICIWSGTFYIEKMIPDEQIALHYNVDFGIDYYGDISNIYIIPILGLFIALFNTLLLSVIKKHKDFLFLSHLLLSMALIANIILTTAIISIFLINY